VLSVHDGSHDRLVRAFVHPSLGPRYGRGFGQALNLARRDRRTASGGPRAATIAPRIGSPTASLLRHLAGHPCQAYERRRGIAPPARANAPDGATGGDQRGALQRQSAAVDLEADQLLRKLA